MSEQTPSHVVSSVGRQSVGAGRRVQSFESFRARNDLYVASWI